MMIRIESGRVKMIILLMLIEGPVSVFLTKSNTCDYEELHNYAELTCSLNSLVTDQHIPILRINSNYPVYKIQFKNSTITEIPTGIFERFSEVSELYINNSKVEHIALGAFHGLKKLNLLDLSNNELSELEKGVLNSLSLLRYLNISNNRLAVIENKAFLGINKLQYLNISNNNLTEKGLIYLRDLQVIVLDMSYNFIKNISVNFDKNLIELNVSSNRIEELNGSIFSQSQKLEKIDLSYNLILHINEDLFLGLFELKELYLQNNKITHLPRGLFSSLNSLTTLNLACNEVEEIYMETFGGLSNLAYLDISNNSLSYLFQKSFHHLPALKNLNIKNNLITNLEFSDLLKYTKNLKKISLIGNPWYCESLFKIISFNINIDGGSDHKFENVRGIRCRNFTNYHTTERYENSVFQNPRGDDLKELFNKVFLNSSFYRFFNDFNNSNSVTMFWKNANTEFNNSNFSNLLFNFSKSIDMLDKTLKSINLHSKSNENSNTLLHYLDQQFQNSTFYNLFSKYPNFSGSRNTEDFEKHLYPIALNISNQLQDMKETFVNVFKNFSYYKFDDNKSADYHQIVFNKDEVLSKITAAKYVDNSQNSTPKESLYYTLNQINILLIVVVIILLIFGLKDVLPKIFNRFNNIRNIAIPTNLRHTVSSASELELN